ncbi:MAG: hypothetical protein HY906_27240 [Deltaproteobacteria bacterium]|nr:hypothetical protein [Deltaproteobacteria bacterium]
MRLGESPFFLLGLTPACSRLEVEREGQKLMAMLEVGMEEARRYPTPLGERERTVEQVRQAMADLRDPARRLGEELWAMLPAQPVPLGYADEEAARQRRPLVGARTLLGWGPSSAAVGAPATPVPPAAAPAPGAAKTPQETRTREATIFGASALGTSVVLALCGLPLVLAVAAGGGVGAGVWWATRRRTAAARGVGDLGPVAAAAREALRNPDPPLIGRAEVEIAHLARLEGEGILAAGLLSAARDDLPQARLLIESLEDAEPLATPPAVLRAAAEFLLADALERGDLRAATDIGRRHAERSPLLRFLHLAADRLYGVYLAGAAAELQDAWKRCPEPQCLAGLYERARVATRLRFDDDEDRAIAVQLPTDPLGAALVLHAACHRAPATRLRRADLGLLVSAWDRVFSAGEWQRILCARAALLGGGSPDEAATAFRDTVARELAALARAAALPLSSLKGPTAEAAAYRLRQTLLDEFEPAAQALRARVDEQRALPAADEWRAWVALRGLALEAVRLTGQEGHRQVFAPLHATGSHLSAWLYNARHESYLSNLIDRGLLSQAFAVGSDATVERLEQNVQLGV